MPPREVQITREHLEKLIQLAAAGLLVVLLLVAVSTSWFTLEAKNGEQAAIQRFGRVLDIVTEPGIHFKMPFGIDTVTVERVQEVRRAEIGFRSAKRVRDEDDAEGGPSFEDEPEHSIAITKDQNLVDAEYVIQYEISSLQKYLFRSSYPDWTVRQAAKAVMREVIGNRTIDDVLTTGRDDMQQYAREQLQKVLDAYDVGIRVKSVQFQDVHAPQAVIPAFDDVQKAREERETLLNEGKRYANTVIPKAEGEAKKLITEAEGYKIRRLNEAGGDAARFRAIYESYLKNPELTRRQLYLQVMSEILPGMEKTIFEGDGGSYLLPLDGRKEKKP